MRDPCVLKRRAFSSTRAKPGDDANGSGIGLALVRLMLERTGGRVELEGSPLGGARFIIGIPRA
jgi:signal transduction histidine kinase